MKKLPIILLWLLFSGVLFSQRNPPQNVLFILVDDLGWRDLGYMGSPLYHTPHLDALAKEAVVFTQAYSAHPVCSPSRAALMTGKNPIRIGISDWIPGSDPKNKMLLGPQDLHELPHEEVTIAEILKDRGYKTFFAGKWHLGDEGNFPEDQGFDINIGGHHKGSPPGGYYSPYKNPKLEDGPEGEYLTDRLTSETIDFIKAHKDEKFLAYLSYYTVHTPIQANKKHRPYYDDVDIEDKRVAEGDGETLLYQNNLDYASMVTAMDENVGRLIKTLKDEGLWENTLLVFTSDNGGLSTLPKGWNIPTSIFPKRAGKGWAYEGGISIPQIIHHPGLDEPHQFIDQPTIHMDILPTILSALKVNAPDRIIFDGKDVFEPDFANQRKAEPLFWHFPHYHGSTWTPGSAVRLGDYKLVYFYEDESAELYNLAKDPEESINLVYQQRGLALRLKNLLFKLIDESHGKYPVSNNSDN